MKRLKKVAFNSTLVVVDVQKDFSNFFTEEYLESLESYVSQFPRVIVVVDDNSGDTDIPYFLKNCATDVLYKSYGGFEQEYIEELMEDGEIEIIKEDEVYKYGENLIVPGNVHENFLVPSDMVAVFKELQQVTIVGGADQECLDDVENALQHLNVEVKRNNNLIYSFSNKNENYLKEDYHWVKP